MEEKSKLQGGVVNGNLRAEIINFFRDLEKKYECIFTQFDSFIVDKNSLGSFEFGWSIEEE